MRWTNLLFCCLFLAFTLAGASAPLFASDIEPPRKTQRDDRLDSEEAQAERLEEYCFSQRQICRKICNLRSRFEDRFDGCPSSCDSREVACFKASCFRWSEREFLIAERFGGYKCAQ